MLDIVDVVAVREAVGRLTKRQQEVCQLLINGHTQEEIAATLGCTQQTVSDHVRRIRAAFREMGFDQRVLRSRKGAKDAPMEGGPRAEGELRLPAWAASDER
jgi:DNA-binding CsgD family transcriptional regulator